MELGSRQQHRVVEMFRQAVHGVRPGDVADALQLLQNPHF